MSLFSARRVIPACIISAASVVALAAPGVASASIAKKCAAQTLSGEGSSAQKIAQREVWIKDFESATDGNTYACKGTVKITKYGAEGSGAGLESMGAEGALKMNGTVFQYNGTDEAPNEAQKIEIEKHDSAKKAESLETIPVVQFAVAVIVHLPNECVATSTPAVGRLVLTNSQLDKLWEGTTTKWGQIKESGDKVTAAVGAVAKTTAECEAAEIKHVVRFDQSGTTHTFKNYLALTPGGTTKIADTNDIGGSEGPFDWSEISEGTKNQSWPTVDNVIRPTAKGGSKEVAKVVEEESSIGYANLADARANIAFKPEGGSPGNGIFWTEVENSGSSATKKLKYADPSTDHEENKEANSNCSKEKFTNGSGEAFPPKSTKGKWNKVTTATKEKKYSICGLTYDLAVDDYETYFEAPTKGQVEAVQDFYAFILSEATGGGQPEITGHDYERLPPSLDAEATKGMERIGW
jgi:ABC-type phosphate transport system substrate-binding protein